MATSLVGHEWDLNYRRFARAVRYLFPRTPDMPAEQGTQFCFGKKCTNGVIMPMGEFQLPTESGLDFASKTFWLMDDPHIFVWPKDRVSALASSASSGPLLTRSTDVLS